MLVICQSLKNFLNGASTMLNSVLIFLRSLVFINGFLPLTYEERKRVITPLTIIFFFIIIAVVVNCSSCTNYAYMPH